MGRRWVIFGGIALIVVASLIVAAYIGYIHIPSIEDQVASKGDLTVRIVNPPSDSWYPADAAIPFLSTAQSARNIVALEYWVDGKLIQSEPRAPGSSPRFVVQTWRWMPLVEGDHLVTVRARSESGTVATSNIVRIHASPAAGFRIIHTVKQGETWESIAKLCTTSIEAIASQNPLLDPKESLPPGLEMWIPCDPIFASAPAAEAGTPSLSDAGAAAQSPWSAADVPVWISQNLSPAGTLPATPVLKAGLDGCTVSLLVQDASKDEQGFLVYRAGATNFEQIAQLGSNQGGSFTFDDNLQVSGPLQYYVAAFNAAGEAQSNIVSVQATGGSCGPVSNPNVAFADGILSVGSGLDLAYAYASLDKSPWQRVPEGEEFFQPAGGRVDLTGYMEPLLAAKPGTRAADLEVWGWRGGVIENLGLLHITFERTTLEYCGAAPEPCTGDVGGSNWSSKDTEIGSNMPIGAQALTFRFRANTAGANHVLAQISSQPFTSDYQPNPPFLISASPVIGTLSSGLLHGEFTVQFSNFSKLKDSGKSPVQSNPNWFLEDLLGPNQPTSLSPFASSLIDLMNEGAAGKYMSDLAAPTYYVRVIPWEGNGPVGKASNTIAITYHAIEQKPLPIIAEQPAIYDIKIVNFTGVQQIVGEIYGCLQITGVDETKMRRDAAVRDEVFMRGGGLDSQFCLGPGTSAPCRQDTEAVFQSLVQDYRNLQASGDPYCPPPAPPLEDPSAWNDLGDAISSTWTVIVETYEQLKDGLVELMATFVFKPITGCGDDCKALLKTGLNMAITYFTGIPPNLPTTEELINDGLNYAIDMAIEQAGVDCGGLCRWQIEEGLKITKEALKESGSQPGCWTAREDNASRFGRLPLCLPAGVTGLPIPGAGYQPPMTEVQITRTGQAIVASARQYDYSLQVTTSIFNDALVGQTFRCPWGFYHDANTPFAQDYLELPVPEPAEGTPYETVKLQMPGSLGEVNQLTLPVIFREAKEGTYTYPPYKQQPARCSSRLLTSPGYVITVNAVLMCTDVATNQTAPCPASEYGSAQDTKQFTP